MNQQIEEFKQVFEGAEVAEATRELKDATARATAEWDTRREIYLADYKRRHKIRRKHFTIGDLPVDAYQELDAISQKIIAEFRIEELATRMKELRAAREQRLEQLARQIDLGDLTERVEMHDIRSCDMGTYSTQTQPGAYAKGQLQPMERRLLDLGYKAEIRYRETYRGTGHSLFTGRPETYAGGTYSLWTDCPRYAYEVITRQTDLRWVVQQVFALGLNPLVYIPTGWESWDAAWQWAHGKTFPGKGSCDGTPA